MGNVEVRKSSLIEHDAFWLKIGNDGSAIERSDLEDLLECLSNFDFGVLKIQDLYGNELVLETELDEDYNEIYTLSVIKKEEVENTDEKQVFKKTRTACETLTETEVKSFIANIQKELEEY